MTVVGIISDTHGRLAVAAYAALADSDVIIHAGDIGNPEIIRELETLAPVHAVLGNNDYREYGDQVGRFAQPRIDGVRFLISHYPKDVRIGETPALSSGDPIPRICIHGHTHLPKLIVGKKVSPADLILCPGSASRPRNGERPTVAHIVLEKGTILRASVETFDGTEVLGWSRYNTQ